MCRSASRRKNAGWTSMTPSPNSRFSPQNGPLALFLRKGKLCIWINDLSYSQSSCAQSYPQKDVQNIDTLNSRMAQSSRTRICPQNPPLPCFCAAWIFPYKSMLFPTVKSLAHNLIHKRCAEPAARLRLTVICFFDANAVGIIAFAAMTEGNRPDFRLFATVSALESYLSSMNFPIRIKALSYCQVHCSQSYPQKVCRTILAVQLATRYIAGLRYMSFLS